jgi:uncharacterized membrane protein
MKNVFHKFFNIPSVVLFCISILPIVFIEVSPQFWAYLIIFVCAFFSIWIFSITKILLQKNHYDQEIKFGKLTTVLFLTNLYIIFLSIYFAFTFNKYDDPKWLLPIIIIGQFLLFYGLFYIMNFVAKVISTIETKRAVTFTDYSKYFFMLLLFPVGVWWLTPKIQLLK